MSEKIKVNCQFLTLNYKEYEGWGRHRDLIEKYLFFDHDNKIKLVLANPYGMKKKPDEEFIYMSTFEADKLPFEYVGPLNEALAVIVPDEWVKKVYIDSGVTVPIYVVSEGVTDNTIYTPDTKPFTFLHFDFTSFANRKGGDLVLDAFINIFVNMQNKVKLILKGRDHRIPLSHTYSNVEYIFQNYTEQQMNELWQRTNCFVFPSRGEGFGLPPLESMAHGIPTILTNGSAMASFANYGLPLSIMGKRAATYEHLTGYGKWDQPDTDELRKIMLYVYHNYEQEKQRAVENAKNVWEKYNFEKIAPQLAETINKIVAEVNIVNPGVSGEVLNLNEQ
jgi:glycosyltransferase involved in cell wall biosynthesis